MHILKNNQTMMCHDDVDFWVIQTTERGFIFNFFFAITFYFSCCEKFTYKYTYTYVGYIN